MNDDIRVVCTEDCGNAPKKVLIRDFESAVARRDTDSILQYLTDDCVWEILGSERLDGADQIVATLNDIKRPKPREIVIDTIITHGNAAASNGQSTFATSRQAFCNIFHLNSFKNPKINRISSYWIDLK